MSSWSEIRARTNDPLSSTINSLITRQNQANAITDEITDAETIFPVRILNSKLSLDDKDLSVGYSKPVSQAFFMPFEPDGDIVKLWARFDSGGVTVTDYSSFKNNIEIRYDDENNAPQPELLMTAEDDGVAKNKISSYLEKSKKHYFRITDPQFQLSPGNKNFSFFFKIFPTIVTNVTDHGKRAVLLNYIENDQVSHAVRVELDDDGYVYFFIRWDYVDYFVKSGAPLFNIPEAPDYYAQDYDDDDYYASPGEETFTLPLQFTYIFCTFDKDSKVATILNPIDTETVNTWSSNSIPIPKSANLSLWLPLNEGSGQTLNDTSGLGNHGSMHATASRRPTWVIKEGRNALSFGMNDYASVPNSTSLNTFTTGWTISLFVYLNTGFYSQTESKYIFGHGSGLFNAGSILLYAPEVPGRRINLSAYNQSGTLRFTVSNDTALPATENSLVHIVATYDGTDYKLYVDKILVGTLNAAGDTHTNSAPWSFGHPTNETLSAPLTHLHTMVWKNVALSPSDVETLYDSVIDLMESEFTTSPFPPYYDEPPAPPAPGTPTTLPFTQTPYNQTSGTAFSPIKPVTVSGLTEIYNVAGGTPVADPQLLKYDVAPGTAGVGEVTTLYNLSGGSGGGSTEVYYLQEQSSTGDIETNQDSYGQRVHSTSSNLYNKSITSIQIWLKGANSPGGTVALGVIRNNGSFTQFGSSFSGSSLTSDWVSYTRTGSASALAVGDAVGIRWTGGSGDDEVHIRRGGSNHYENSSWSSQSARSTGGSWQDNNSFSMAGRILAGGETFAVLDTSTTFFGQGVKNASSVLNGKELTEITMQLSRNDIGSGTYQLGVMRSNQTWIGFGTTGSQSSLNSGGWTSITKAGGPTVLGVGDAIGVRYTGQSGSAQLHLRRGNSGSHVENASWSSEEWITNGNWGASTAFSIAGTLKGGGAVLNPYWNIVIGTEQPYAVGETFGTSSALLGITPTKIELRVYRHASATGTVYLRHVDSANTVKATLKTQAVSGLPTAAPTTFNFTWEDLTYDKPIAANDKIMVVLAGGNSNPVYVLGNQYATGTPASYDGTNSILVRRISANPGSFGFGSKPEAWTSHSTIDISGKMYSGGNDFTSYIHIDGTRKRTGIKVDTASSSLVGKKITKVTATLKKFGTPTVGAIYCRIRNSAGTERVTLNQADISSVSTTDTSVEFLNTTHNISLALDDTISLEYELGDASNYIMVRVNKNQYEGVNTILFESLASSINTATAINDRDLSGILHTGGEIDTTARPRVGLSVNNSNSSLWGKAITRVRLWLTRNGSSFGDAGNQLSVKVIRGSDKIVVATLGTKDILDVSTAAAGTAYDFTNIANSYVMADGDLIVVESLFGNTTNYISVKRSTTDVINGTATCLIDWNGNAYNLTTNNDLNMTAWTGGYTVYPDPNIPTPPQPYHYSHDMFFGSSTTPDSNAEILPHLMEPDAETMFTFIAADFRVYQGMLITVEQALNLFKNKYSISEIAFTEVDVVAHSLAGPLSTGGI